MNIIQNGVTVVLYFIETLSGCVKYQQSHNSFRAHVVHLTIVAGR